LEQQTGTKVRVLVATTPATAQLLPKEIHPSIGVVVTQPHTITISPGETKPHLLIRRLLIRVLVVPPGGRPGSGKMRMNDTNVDLGSRSGPTADDSPDLLNLQLRFATE
ncbi:hypothetical protein AVEN_119323-1, partial [Araneus ventricosus]